MFRNSPPRRGGTRSISAPGRTRTCDPRLRRPLLYPAELPGRVPAQSLGARAAPDEVSDPCRPPQRPPPPPIDEPEKRKNQISKAVAATSTVTTTIFSAPEMRAVLPG